MYEIEEIIGVVDHVISVLWSFDDTGTSCKDSPLFTFA